MIIRTKEEIAKAAKCGDIFTNDLVQAKKEYHEYCKLYHPDTSNAESYALFEQIQKLWEEAQKLFRVNAWESTDQIRIVKEDGHGFELTYKQKRAFEFGSVYIAARKVILVYEKEYEEFYNRYLHNVKRLRFADDRMKLEMEQYLPKVVTAFKASTGQYCIVLDKTPDVHSLASIQEQYQENHQYISGRQVAWMLNRLFNFNCYMNWLGFAHNGLNTEHIFLSMDWHRLFFYGGWEYMTKFQDKMIGCPSEVYQLLPFITKDNKKASITTDLLNTKAIGKCLMDPAESKVLLEYLRQSPKKLPMEEWEIYGQVLSKVYGRPRFIVWDMEQDLKDKKKY